MHCYPIGQDTSDVRWCRTLREKPVKISISVVKEAASMPVEEIYTTIKIQVTEVCYTFQQNHLGVHPSPSCFLWLKTDGNLLSHLLGQQLTHHWIWPEVRPRPIIAWAWLYARSNKNSIINPHPAQGYSNCMSNCFLHCVVFI